MRVWIPLMAVLALAACGTTVPDSGAGVGFDDYAGYDAQRQRDAALASSARAASGPATGPASVITPAPGMPQPVSPLHVGGGPGASSASSSPSTEAPAASGAPTAAEINAALGRESAAVAPAVAPAPAPSAAPSAPMPTVASTTLPGGGSHASISDEQSFEAVSSRESIQSDAERIREQRSQYRQAPVTALPDRPQESGPNLAQYALSTRNAPGEKVYRRGFTSQRKYDRACRSFPSAAQAQTAFLADGGPQKDRLGVDPDGDGFACGWDPRPFRAARG